MSGYPGDNYVNDKWVYLVITGKKLKQLSSQVAVAHPVSHFIAFPWQQYPLTANTDDIDSLAWPRFCTSTAIYGTLGLYEGQPQT